jgi:outer membrane protein
MQQYGILNMKILTKLILVSFLCSFSVALASEEKVPAKNDYYANYYEDEGSLLFKIRGFYGIPNAKATNMPAPTNAGASKPGRIAENAYGFDTAMTIFATDNIAAEIALGLGFYKTKTSVLEAAIGAYGTPAAKSIQKRNQVFMIPVTMSLQYHVAPFGGIRPYIGGGYNGTYMYTRSNAFKVRNAYGPVLQIGVDFIAKDDTLFTFDIRQYFLKSKLTFKKAFLGTDSNVSSKVDWNPLVISLGFGFKF